MKTLVNLFFKSVLCVRNLITWRYRLLLTVQNAEYIMFVCMS